MMILEGKNVNKVVSSLQQNKLRNLESRMHETEKDIENIKKVLKENLMKLDK